jgi:hypothetical protein
MSALISPGLLLSVILCIAYASVFHFWRGRTLRDFAMYTVAAALGFGAGQLVGMFTRISWLQIGEVHVVEATLGAWLAMAALHLALTPTGGES